MNEIDVQFMFPHTPARTEHVQVKMKLDRAKAIEHAESVCAISPATWTAATACAEGDTITLTYELLIEYFGDICRKLEATARLCADPGVVVEANTEELLHGRCLAQEIFGALEKVREQCEKRLAAEPKASRSDDGTMLCLHCGSNVKPEMRQNGPHAGLYCPECGKWMKWASRAERASLEPDDCPFDDGTQS